jgi:hypothetical protein
LYQSLLGAAGSRVSASVKRRLFKRLETNSPVDTGIRPESNTCSADPGDVADAMSTVIREIRVGEDHVRTLRAQRIVPLGHRG